MNKKLAIFIVLLAMLAIGVGCETAEQGQACTSGPMTFLYTEGDNFVVYRCLSDFMLPKGKPRAIAVVFRPIMVPVDEQRMWGNAYSSNRNGANIRFNIEYSDGMKIGYEYDQTEGQYNISHNGQTVSLEKNYVYFMDGTIVLRKVSYAELGLVMPKKTDESCGEFMTAVEPTIKAYVEKNTKEIFGVELTAE